MEWLARLKIDWPILHLQQNIFCELTVERLEIFIGSARAVIAGFHVIDKSAPDHDAAMRRDSGSQHIGAVCVTAIVGAWPGLTLTIRLDEKATKVRNQFVNFIRFLFPPRAHLSVEWIRCLQTAQLHRRGKARGEINLDAVRT